MMNEFPFVVHKFWTDGFDLFHPKRWCVYNFGRHNFREQGGVFCFKKIEHANAFEKTWTKEMVELKSKEAVDPRRSSVFRRV